MCIVAELIEKLKDLPQDAIVEVLAEDRGQYDSSTSSTSFKSIDLEYGISIVDFTTNEDITSHLYGKIFVHLSA